MEARYSIEPATVDAGRPILLDHLVEAYQKRKWLVIAIIVASGLAAALFSVYFPFSRRADVTLYPLSEFEIAPFQDPSFEKFLKFDSATLTTVFVDAIRDGTLLRKALIANNVVERGSAEKEEDFDFRLERAMVDFEIKGPAPETARAGNRNWQVLYKSKNAVTGYRVVNDVIKGANTTVIERLRSRYELNESSYLRNRDDREKELRQKRANLLADYDRTTAMRLAEMEEQISVLKQSGSKLGQMASTSDKFVPGQQISVVDANKYVFIPGYEQIERSAELIRNRRDKENFIAGLLEVDQAIRDIEQDQAAIRGRLSFRRLLSNNAEFQAMRNDLTRASFAQSSARIIAALVILGAGMALAAFVMFAGAYRVSRRQAL